MPRTDCTHQLREPARARWRREQVHVVAHQDIGMHAAFEAVRVPAQPAKKGKPIALVEKAGGPGVSAPDYVLGDAGRM